MQADTIGAMDLLVIIGYIGGVIGFLATIIAGVIVTRSSATKATIETQKELISTLVTASEAQKDQISDLNSKYAESSTAIAGLQGQIDVLKNIPLKEISEGMAAIVRQLNKLSSSQENVLKLLENNSHSRH